MKNWKRESANLTQYKKKTQHIYEIEIERQTERQIEEVKRKRQRPKCVYYIYYI